MNCREIKFRAWDKADNRMLSIEEINFISRKARGVYHNTSTDCGNYFEKFNNLELMQYTGLKDKNKEEIYEGDIVAVEHGTGMHGFKSTRYKVFNCPVIFLNGQFQYSWPKDYGNYRFGLNLEKSIVIGNIYQNPELLKESTDGTDSNNLQAQTSY